MPTEPFKRENYISLSAQYADTNSLMHKKLQLVGSYITSGKALLDFGTGTGDLIALEAHKFDDLYEVDVSEESVNICHNRFKNNANIHIVENSGNDLESLFADTRFDCVAACDVLEHLELDESKKLLAAFYSLLDSGGIFVFSGPGIFEKVKIRLRKSHIHDHSHSSYGWSRLIKEVGFQIMHIETVEFRVIHSAFLRKRLHVFGECCVIVAKKSR
jgi:predicted TPR repeat methyltransferase